MKGSLLQNVVRTEPLLHKAVRRLRWKVRDMRPHRWVERDVHGVTMAMPWSHRLPDYAAADPAYGANLVDLVAELARGRDAGDPLQVLDIGANIGDSTLLILDRVDARVLAVEPDEVFLPFLRHNVAADGRVTIEPSLLQAAPSDDRVRSVRVGGTAAFLPDDAADSSVPSLTVEELRERHPEFAGLRLVKTDTDGFDVQLAPAVARAWPESRPVLFFEYDEPLTRRAGLEPRAVWDELEVLGYDACAIWDNGGHPLHRVTLAKARQLVASDYPEDRRDFWDVAVAHRDDAEGRRALDALIPPGGRS
jgi:FkbM family methyltransferase